MTGVDIAVLATVGLSTLISLLRGLIKELLSLVGLVAASMLTVAFFEPAKDYFATRTSSESLAALGAGIGLFVGFSIAFGIVNMIIVKLIHEAGFGMFDRSLGMLFGLLRGVFLVSLVFLVFTTVVSDEKSYPAPLKEAQTLGALKFGSAVLESFIPEEYKTRLEDVSEETKKKLEQKKREEEQRQLIEKNQPGEDPILKLVPNFGQGKPQGGNP